MFEIAISILKGFASLFFGGMAVAGAIWTGYGFLQVGLGFKDHNGPQLQSGILQIIGGAIVLISGAALLTYTLDAISKMTFGIAMIYFLV